MGKIRIDDLKHDARNALTEDELRQVTGGTINLGGGQLEITDDLTISGSGENVDQTPYIYYSGYDGKGFR